MERLNVDQSTVTLIAGTCWLQPIIMSHPKGQKYRNASYIQAHKNLVSWRKQTCKWPHLLTTKIILKQILISIWIWSKDHSYFCQRTLKNQDDHINNPWRNVCKLTTQCFLSYPKKVAKMYIVLQTTLCLTSLPDLIFCHWHMKSNKVFSPQPPLVIQSKSWYECLDLCVSLIWSKLLCIQQSNAKPW